MPMPMPMPRVALAAVLVLAACSTPVGSERTGCGAEWLDAPAVAATGSGVRERTLPVACISEIGVRRLRVGFSLPAGPECHVLQRVELVESAEAVSVTLIGAVNDDPNAGSCPDEERMVMTEMDLAAPIDDRRLLDGGAGQ